MTWLLVLALSHGSATLGPTEFPTERACIAAGESRRYMGKPVGFVCKETR